MKKLNINKIGYVVGILSVLFFLLCSVWGGLFASPTLKELHFNFLQIAYPWFAFTVAGYIIGIIESFIYGWVTGALFAWLHSMVCIEKDNA